MPSLIEVKDKISRLGQRYDREEYEGSLSKFVEGAWPYIDSAKYQSCWALDAFCEHLEAVTYGHIKRLLVNYPFRCSKTSIGSICWPAWVWAQQYTSFTSGPRVRFLCASYGSIVSLQISNRSRRLIQSPWYQSMWGDRFLIKDDQNTKTQFDNDKGGSRMTTSVGGSLLGLGGDVINIDDPQNTEPERAKIRIEGENDFQRVAGWWKEMSSTRLNDQKQSAIVVNMQRLSKQDLSGVILDTMERTGEDWVHLMIPMEYERARHCVTVKLPQYEDDAGPWEDPRTEEGELMWPKRFGPVEIARIKSQLGPYMAAGRLQQAPVPKGGGIIDEAWWRTWDHEEAIRYGLEWSAARKEFPHCDLIVGSIDTAFGRKEENDYSAMTVWGVFVDRNGNRRAMLMYAWQKRLRLNGLAIEARPGEAEINFKQRQQAEWGLVEWIAHTCRRYRIQRLLIEDKARGRDTAEEINRQFLNNSWGVQLLNPAGDKVSRVHAIVPLFTDGTIWAPDTPWAQTVINQCSIFPKGDHDDIVDTVSQFLAWGRDNGVLLRCEEMSDALADEMSRYGQRETVADQYGVA